MKEKEQSRIKKPKPRFLTVKQFCEYLGDNVVTPYKQKTMGDLRSGKFILAYYKIKEEQVFEYFLNTCSSLIL